MKEAMTDFKTLPIASCACGWMRTVKANCCGNVYPAIAPTMKKDFPEVEDFCRLHDAELLLSNDERNVKFSETKGYFADPASLRMLAVDMQKGNPATALSGPDKIVISQSMAKKYFGDGEPVGKRLVVRDPQGTWTYEVAGVFHDYPRNSHLIIEYLVSYATLGKIIRTAWGDTTNATETSWGWYDFYSYLLLKPGADWRALEAKLPAFCDRYINSQEFARNNNIRGELSLLPMSDIHLYSNYNQEAEVNGNGRAVSFLFLIAFFIIGIAWINYINLATARSLERAREIGVRKVLGASVASIAGLLSKDFVKLVLAANLVAWPIAYFAMNRWLQDFAYRVNIGWWVFALAGGLALLIALVTVSTQAIKAVLANPVEALRYE
jgi:putative ABC transport system permease protein